MSDSRIGVPLKMVEYINLVKESNRFAGARGELSSLQLGLFGEVGDLFASVKKSRRDSLTGLDAVSEEFGDALWYLFAIAVNQRIDDASFTLGTLRELGKLLGAAAPRRMNGHPTFRQVQGFVEAHAGGYQGDTEVAVRSLAGKVGELVSHSGKKVASSSIFSILALFFVIAWKSGLSIEKIAGENIRKIRGRWPGPHRSRTPLFDAQCMPAEQLPRKIWVRFDERTVRGVSYVYISLNGVSVGDRLTDNSHTADDYRFHDVFHIAYAACLGWSPVFRSLLKAKRKTIPQLDENEDGARAIIIEEGISTWMFNLAREHLFAGVDEAGFPYSVLKQLSSFVKGYEVEVCQPWEWADAVLTGFRIFRELKTHRRGYVFADLDLRTASFKKIEDVEEKFCYQEVCARPGKSRAKRRI